MKQAKELYAAHKRADWQIDLEEGEDNLTPQDIWRECVKMAMQGEKIEEEKTAREKFEELVADVKSLEIEVNHYTSSPAWCMRIDSYDPKSRFGFIGEFERGHLEMTSRKLGYKIFDTEPNTLYRIYESYKDKSFYLNGEVISYKEAREFLASQTTAA